MRLQPLLVFDFDGTLAPIVPRPDAARVSVALARRLDMLSHDLPVAVVTGRTVLDVAPRLGFAPRFVIGNHGAEDPAVPARDAGRELDALRTHLRLHAASLKAAGVDVEDKRYTIAFHYRLAEDRPNALETINSVLRGAAANTKVFGGKCVVNVVPDNAPDKADAVEVLVRRCGSASVVFVGDDMNDEAVFIRAQPNWLTVRVGRDDAGSQALYFLDSITEVGMMLHRMLELAGAA